MKTQTNSKNLTHKFSLSKNSDNLDIVSENPFSVQVILPDSSSNVISSDFSDELYFTKIKNLPEEFVLEIYNGKEISIASDSEIVAEIAPDDCSKKRKELKMTLGEYFIENNLDIEEDIDCRNNNITSLEGLPEGFNSIIDCRNNNITSLRGLPKGFNSDIYCDNNNLNSLEDLPDGFNSTIFCDNNNITSLRGLPKGFNSDIYCYNNNLNSLEGLPEGFNSIIDCRNNNITSLEDLPDGFNSTIFCDNNNNLTPLEGHSFKIILS